MQSSLKPSSCGLGSVPLDLSSEDSRGEMAPRVCAVGQWYDNWLGSRLQSPFSVLIPLRKVPNENHFVLPAMPSAPIYDPPTGIHETGSYRHHNEREDLQPAPRPLCVAETSNHIPMPRSERRGSRLSSQQTESDIRSDPECTCCVTFPSGAVRCCCAPITEIKGCLRQQLKQSSRVLAGIVKSYSVCTQPVQTVD